jgi:predicted phosphate transport protein (TIGR00153 family)
MLGRFLPKQKNFFTLFCQAADKLIEAAQQSQKLVADISHVQQHAEAIDLLERQGDAIARSTYQLLHNTFITPFDRHDINTLITRLDDILDQINRLAQRILIYHFAKLPDEILQLAKLLTAVTELLRKVIGQLESLRNQDEIMQLCLNIDTLENDAEVLLLKGLKRLFAEETDCKQLIKLKEVLEQKKAIINGCQDAANLVKSIMLEYA